ncbi:MAG: universal stress protein [Myxococcales bacterium]
MTPLNKIICPIDFSPGSDHALGRAAELARAFGAELELLHVFQLPVLALPDVPITLSPTYVADLTQRIQKQLDLHARQLRDQGLRVKTSVLEGPAAETITDHAKKFTASMLVLGTHGRSGFKRFLLGSVAERVVRLSSVPVMTVHLPEGA